MMFSKSFKKASRVASVVLAAVFLGMAAGPAPAAEEAALGLCEKVVLECLGDAIASAFLSLGASLGPQIAFCLVGYSFCERFVEPLLERR